MIFRNWIIGCAIALALNGAVSAQVLQTGVVSPGHATSWATNGVVQDAGTAAAGSINTLGVTATGTPFCINDALTTAPGGYHEFCLGANALGGGLISYNAYGGASSLPLQININGVTSSLGTGTINSGTANQVTYYGTTGTTVSGNPNLTISGSTLRVGVSGTSTGSLLLSSAGGGIISLATSGSGFSNFEFDLPTSAGTTGQVLTSQGGAGSPMTWANVGGNVNAGSAGQFGYYAGSGNTISGSSVLTITGTALSASGSFTASTLAANTTISAGVAGSSLGALSLSGNTAGTIILKSLASTGSYNFILPASAGTSGQPLLSGGGGASAMTYGNLSGTTNTFATTTGSLTSGHAAVFDGSGNIADGGPLPTGTINSGTAGQFSYYAGSGTTLTGNANLTISSGAVTVGVTGAQAGSVILTGSSTGAITLKGAGSAIGTYNFNFPTTAGTSGQPLLSGGGSAAAMTFGTLSGNTTKFGTVTGSFTNGDCIAADASGNLIDNGSTCGTGGSGTVTSSTAGQVAYYPSSTNAVAGNSALTIVGGAITFGVPTTTQGQLKLSGATSGTITVTGQAAAGTYEFDLPITAGSAGQVLTSAGGAGAPMIWAAPGLSAVTTQTSSFNATANSSNCVDTSGGAVTATLPASPANNDTIQFLPCSAYATNNLILARNGNNIQLLAQNLTVATNSAAFSVKFVTSYGWIMF